MPPTYIHFKTTTAMKQKLHQSLLVTLVTMLLALTASSASAQTTYDLWVAGVQVTSANCGDLTVIPGISGKVSYNPDTQTLTLDDATINGNLVIYTPLTCVVKGYVSITATGDAQAIGIFRDAVIKGDGELTLKSQKNSGIYTEASLVINRCTVSIEGKEGITGYEGTHRESLAIKNATVTVKGREGSICNLASLTLEGGCKIAKPAGAVWNDDKHALCDAAGNIITDEVVITPKGGTAIDFVTPELQPAEGAIYDMNGVLRSEPLEELPTGVYIIGGRKVMHVQR